MALSSSHKRCISESDSDAQSSNFEDIAPSCSQPRFKPRGRVRGTKQGSFRRRKEIASIEWSGITLSINDAVRVEVEDKVWFLRIFRIWQEHGVRGTKKTILRGLQFLRAEDFLSAIPHGPNEVVCDINFAKDDRRPIADQAIVEADLSDVTELIKLKVICPLEPGNRRMSLEGDEEDNIFRCKWLRYNIHETSRHRDNCKGEAREQVLRQVTVIEADPNLEKIADLNLDVQKGKRKASPPVDERPRKRAHTMKDNIKPGLTFIDLFAGAGGVTIAAKEAGFRATQAVDNDPVCCETLRYNHPEIKVRERDVTEIHVWGRKIHADYVHISTPCPFWSMMKVRACDDESRDERNRASLYCVGEVLKTSAPRMFSIEQVTGLVKKIKHTGDLFALLGQITDAGYKLTWRFCNFAENGNVQNRTRFILFAARQDIPLPRFPDATHGEPGYGKTPWTSVRDVLTANGIDLRDCCVPFKRIGTVGTRSHPDDQLPGAIMTSGSIHHWSGRGNYSLDALKAFQEFPADYEIIGNNAEVQKQIGNAVPSKSFSAYTKEVYKTLEDVDMAIDIPRCSMFNATVPFTRQAFTSEIIVID